MALSKRPTSGLLPRPKTWRVVLAFVIAPLVATWLYIAIEAEGTWGLLPFAMIAAYLSTLFFGVPAYILPSILSRAQGRPHLWAAMLIGGIVAVIPWTLLTGGVQHSQVGSCVTVIEGRMTTCGLLLNLKLFGETFAFGMFGGLVFWTLVAWHGLQHDN
jgi:hypothetical protein